MGFDGSKKVLHTLAGISVEELRLLGLAMAAMSNVTRNNPIIDIDASWLGYHIGHGASGSVGRTIDVAKFFVKSGFIVNLICDGPIRHHSKLASTLRKGKREKARIDSLATRRSLAEIATKLTEENLGEDAKKKLRDDAKKAESLLRGLERKSIKIIGDDFEKRLKREIDEKCDGLGITWLQAEYQADSLLAKRRQDAKSDIILSADSDFSVLVSGPCLVVKDFKTSGQSNECSKFELYTPTAQIMSDVVTVKSELGGCAFLHQGLFLSGLESQTFLLERFFHSFISLVILKP